MAAAGSARPGGRCQPHARDHVDAVVGGAAAGGGAAGVRITRAWTVARAGRGECCTGVGRRAAGTVAARSRSEEHTSELQSLMRISYAVFCLKNTIFNYS